MEFTKEYVGKVLNGEVESVRARKVEIIGKMASIFKKIEIEDVGSSKFVATNFVICVNCNKIYAEGGGKMRKHAAMCRNKEAVSKSAATTKADVTEALAKYFARSAKPLNFLECSEFRKLCEDLLTLGQGTSLEIDSKSIMPSRKTVKHRLMEGLELEIENIKKMLEPAVKSISISFMLDFGKCHDNFLAIKCSYLMEHTNENGT
ncbi:hypothetical protein B9Z55_023491 [Caenorhabditis nigoni]|uniref:Uncharacterized protein n=1 Tax=Caenorhabditis nigoni TaxID=1611254 RepID=A0A2G5SQB1_9PELO|nr:hypothetical protein B9Z55_023491 [Caenorhabditis nigoni]